MGNVDDIIRVLKWFEKKKNEKKKKKILTSDNKKNKLKKKKSIEINDEKRKNMKKRKQCWDLRHYRWLAVSNGKENDWWSDICRAASGGDGDGGYELDPDHLEQFKRVNNKVGLCYFPVLDDEYHKYIVESTNFKRYARSWVESDGFDIDWAVGVAPCLSITHEPLCIHDKGQPQLNPHLSKLAERALQKYNSTHETANYELVRLVKANRRLDWAAYAYYITFLAIKKTTVEEEEDEKNEAAADTFRARVYDFSIGDRFFRASVYSVYISPPPPPPSSSFRRSSLD
ncbi:unnamed protein product [Cuscuta campestris]|uniref:Uncharacterized protein n=1 Tax=Cuscuta campestris TaxID=132261 RepID=A0A484M4K9_9ASTE|nr:unnamed protein product [Cuscuta campestris]